MNTIVKTPRWLLLGAVALLLGSPGGGDAGWATSVRAQAPAVEDTHDTPVGEEVGSGAGTVVDESHPRPDPESGGQSPRERMSVGGSLSVREDETVLNAVTLFGSSDVAGAVSGEMVTLFGQAKMTGKVDQEMVTVFGNAEVDGSVGHECVVVFGNLRLGPDAKVGSECVAVFGSVDRHPDAELEQEPLEILPMFSGLGDWLTDGLLLGRLIPPRSALAWIVVGLHLLLYGFIALLLPRQVQSCTRELDLRPLRCLGVGILTLILLAPLYVILAATGVGVVLIPFIALTETVLLCLGKTSTFEFFGFQIFRGFGRGSGSAPLAAFVVGFILVTLVYMVPVLGLLAWMILRPVALGAAVLAGVSAIRKNSNEHVPSVPVPPLNPPAPVAEAEPVAGSAQPLTSLTLPPPVVMPRAGFWIRLTATALDFIALSWVLMLPYLDSFFLFFWLAYHIGMWSWKGTTIGGIVLNLKVVRLDGRDADVSVCLVRGLASLFSFLPLLLGFFWAGWTAERQSWHDKIAGTVIVRVPRGISLI
jgi:uncharacterized RDD family membrane protein YckC